MAKNKNKNKSKVAIIISIILVLIIIGAIVALLLWRNSISTKLGDDTGSTETTTTEDTNSVLTDTSLVETTTYEPIEMPDTSVTISDTTKTASSELSGGGTISLNIKAPKVTAVEFGENAEKFNELINTEIDQFSNLYAQALANEDYQDEKEISFEMSYEVYNQEMGIVSVLLCEESYTGGAHQQRTYKAYNFNLQEGALVDLETGYFAADKKTVYTTLKAQIIEKMKQDPDKYFSCEDDCLDKVFGFSNILITKFGIAVYFKEYDIAPYAEGMIKFDFTSQEIASLMPY